MLPCGNKGGLLCFLDIFESRGFILKIVVFYESSRMGQSGCIAARPSHGGRAWAEPFAVLNHPSGACGQVFHLCRAYRCPQGFPELSRGLA